MKVLQLHVGACKFTCAPAAWGCYCLHLIYNLILLTLPLPLLMPLLQSPCRQHEKQRKCPPALSPPPLVSTPIMRAVSWDTDWKVCPWEFAEIFAGFWSPSNAEESTEYQNRSWETKTNYSINNWHRKACMI